MFTYLKIEMENFMLAVLMIWKGGLNNTKNGHTQTTRNMNDFEIVLKQEYESLKLARKIELKIKKLKRKDYIEKMINDGYIRITV